MTVQKKVFPSKSPCSLLPRVKIRASKAQKIKVLKVQKIKNQMKIVHWKEIQMQNFPMMIIQMILLKNLYSLADFLGQEGAKKVKKKA